MGAQYDYSVAEESYGVAHDYGHAQSHAHAHVSTYMNMNMDSATAMYTDAGTARAGSQTSTSKTDSVDRLVTLVQYLLLNTVDSLTRTL